MGEGANLEGAAAEAGEAVIDRALAGPATEVGARDTESYNANSARFQCLPLTALRLGSPHDASA